MLFLFLEALLFATAAIVVVGSLIPFIPSHHWWIRAWDFPRLQVACIGLLACGLAPFVSQPIGLLLGVPAALATSWQAYRIWPFTPLHPVEMDLIPKSDSGTQVTIVSSNVEMPNDRFDDVRALIEDTDPDILFLMETDDRWYDALKDCLARYPTIRTHLRDNYYGMIFATRLPVRDLDIVYLSHDDTPTLFAELETPAGQMFRFVGLHPRPPVPGNDTQDRDAELLYAARFARKLDVPLMVVGDFNDAAWSSSSRTFKAVGEYLDPRVGRGLVASFDANRPWLRVPIDQLYVTVEMGVSEFRRGGNVGSDHFPLIARVEMDREIVDQANREPANVPTKKRELADRIVEDYRQRLNRPED